MSESPPPPPSVPQAPQRRRRGPLVIAAAALMLLIAAGAFIGLRLLASSSKTTSSTLALAGGVWKPSLTPAEQSEDAAASAALKQGTPIAVRYHLPPLMDSLHWPRTVEDVDIGVSNFLAPNAFSIVDDESCDSARQTLSSGFAASDIAVVANGTSPSTNTGWLTVQQADQQQGVSLVFTPQSSSMCVIDGLPTSGVWIDSTGAVTGNTVSAAYVGCASMSPTGTAVQIYDAEIGGTAYGLALSSSSTKPGSAPIQTSGLVGVFPSSAHSFAEVTGGTLPQPMPLSGGTLTMAQGMASGSFNVTYQGGAMHGTFACGTPPIAGS